MNVHDCHTQRRFRSFFGCLVAALVICLVGTFPTADAQDSAPLQTQAVTIEREKLDPAVLETLAPIFARVQNAERIRATTKLELSTSINGEVLNTSQGLFQMASQIPNLVSLSAKFDSDMVQMLCDGDHLFIRLSEKDYVQTDAPASLNSFIAALPIQLGPQPDPMLWLSIAGMEPEKLLLEGLSSAKVVDGEPLDDTPTRVIEAARPEGVRWKLRVTSGEDPRPISLSIDMSDMITRSNNLNLPAGYAFEMRYDFDKWIIDGPLDTDLFQFAPPANANRYESLEAYQQAASQHPLLGKPTPTFTAESLAGKSFELTSKPGEVIILDFWATWCGPCRDALPEMQKLVAGFKDQPLKFYAVNVQEMPDTIRAFLKDKALEDLPVLLDPEGQVTNAFATTAIPQTVLIGKTGRIEAVHVGFDSQASFDSLQAEIETLLAGKSLLDSAPQTDTPNNNDSPQENGDSSDSGNANGQPRGN